MTTTSTRVILDLADGISIKDSLTPTISDVLSRCDLTDLSTGLGEGHKWATLEPEEWLLDGNYKLLEEGSAAAQVGVISGTISNNVGTFTTPPELKLTFDADYDLLYGVTLIFPEDSGHFCDDVDIEFYDVGDALIATGSYTPDSFRFFCALPSTPLADIRYIKIIFNSSNANYRHMRLIDAWIDLVIFGDEDIQAANLLEEISPVSVTSPSSSFEFSINALGSDFDVINPAGIYTSLRRNQKIDVYGTIDGTETHLGRFYLVDWEQ